MTSDNQPTQSFDEKLEAAIALFKEQVLGRVNGHGFEQTKLDIKAAIREARPDIMELGRTDDYAIAHEAALDEWSQNMGVE